MESWTWNGSTTMTLTIDGLTVGHSYTLFTDDPNSSFVTLTAASTTELFTVTGIGGFSGTGERFSAILEDDTSGGDSVAANIFVNGTSSSTGYTYNANWVWDGTEIVQVSFIAAAGVTYSLFMGAAPGFSTGGPYTPGSTQTLTLDAGSPLTGGSWALLSDDSDPSGYGEDSIRVVLPGVAGAGTSGNPGSLGGSAPPPNESCIDAIPMLPSITGSYTVDTSGADDPDPLTDPYNLIYGAEVDHAVWYVYTNPSPSRAYLEVTIKNDGALTLHSTVGLFLGTCGSLVIPTDDRQGPFAFNQTDWVLDPGDSITVGVLVDSHERVFVEAGSADGEIGSLAMTISWELLSATTSDTLENSGNLDNGLSAPFGPQMPHYLTWNDGTTVLNETAGVPIDYTYFDGAHWILTVTSPAITYVAPGGTTPEEVLVQTNIWKVWRVTASTVTQYDFEQQFGKTVTTNSPNPGDGYQQVDATGGGRIVTDGDVLWVGLQGTSTAEVRLNTQADIWCQQCFYYDADTDSFLEPAGLSSLIYGEAFLVSPGGADNLGIECCVVDGELLIVRGEAGRFDPTGTGDFDYRSHIIYNRWNKDTGFVDVASLQPAYSPVAFHIFDFVSVYVYEQYDASNLAAVNRLMTQMALTAEGGVPLLILSRASTGSDVAVLDVIDLSDPSVLVYNNPAVAQSFDAHAAAAGITTIAKNVRNFAVSHDPDKQGTLYIRAGFAPDGPGIVEMPDDASSPPIPLNNDTLNLLAETNYAATDLIVDGDRNIWIPVGPSGTPDSSLGGKFVQWDWQCGPHFETLKPFDDVYWDALATQGNLAWHVWRIGDVIYWVNLRSGSLGDDGAFYGLYATRILRNRVLCELGPDVVLAGGLHIWQRF